MFNLYWGARQQKQKSAIWNNKPAPALTGTNYYIPNEWELLYITDPQYEHYAKGEKVFLKLILYGNSMLWNKEQTEYK